MDNISSGGMQLSIGFTINKIEDNFIQTEKDFTKVEELTGKIQEEVVNIPEAQENLDRKHKVEQNEIFPVEQKISL